MRSLNLRGLIGLMAVAGLGCAGPVARLYPPKPGEPNKTVYIVGHGWHTGIAVRRADIPPAVWPENQQVPDADWLEVGWGDAVFYRAGRVTIWNTVQAAFWPTPSALRVVAHSGEFPLTGAAPEMVAVQLSVVGHAELCRFIEGSYHRDRQGTLTELADDNMVGGNFYRAVGKFYLPKTCNTWTARALRVAGAPVSPLYAVTAGNVLWQVRKMKMATPAGFEPALPP